jgi:hypothetical protein
MTGRFRRVKMNEQKGRVNVSRVKTETEMFKAISGAMSKGDVPRLIELVAAGGNMNELCRFGEDTAFTNGYDLLCVCDEAGHPEPVADEVLQSIAWGCRNGARLHYADGSIKEDLAWICGPAFTSPVFSGSTDVIAVLLLHGADPNWSHRHPLPQELAGLDGTHRDSVLGWATHLYEEVVFGINEPPREADWREHYEASLPGRLHEAERQDMVGGKAW